MDCNSQEDVRVISCTIFAFPVQLVSTLTLPSPLSLASPFTGGERAAPSFYHVILGILGAPLGCWSSRLRVKTADFGLTFGFRTVSLLFLTASDAVISCWRMVSFSLLHSRF